MADKMNAEPAQQVTDYAGLQDELSRNITIGPYLALSELSSDRWATEGLSFLHRMIEEQSNLASAARQLDRICTNAPVELGHFTLDSAVTRIFVAKHESVVVGMLWTQEQGETTYLIRLIVDKGWRVGSAREMTDATYQLWMHVFRVYAGERRHSSFRPASAACILSAKHVWMGDEAKGREGFFQLAAAQWLEYFPRGRATVTVDTMWSGCVDGRKDLYGFSLDVIMGPPEAVDMHVDAASSGGIGAILTQPNAVSAAAPVLSQALALLEASVQSEEMDLYKWDLNGSESD